MVHCSYLQHCKWLLFSYRLISHHVLVKLKWLFCWRYAKWQYLINFTFLLVDLDWPISIFDFQLYFYFFIQDELFSVLEVAQILIHLFSLLLYHQILKIHFQRDLQTKHQLFSQSFLLFTQLEYIQKFEKDEKLHLFYLNWINCFSKISCLLTEDSYWLVEGFYLSLFFLESKDVFLVHLFSSMFYSQVFRSTHEEEYSLLFCLEKWLSMVL